MKKSLFYKKVECYRLSWLSRLLLLSIFLLFFFGFVRLVPRFLRMNRPLNGQILVLDGQIPDYAIEKAIELFSKSNYRFIVTTGSNLPEGFYVSGMKTMAQLSRETFLALGFDSTKVIALPTKFVKRNRTFNSANTINEWLTTQHPEIDAIDVFTIGCHSRRSWFLFHKALNEKVNVGVYCIDNRGYQVDTWWKSSIGAREVISETIAYIYVVLTT